MVGDSQSQVRDAVSVTHLHAAYPVSVPSTSGPGLNPFKVATPVRIWSGLQ